MPLVLPDDVEDMDSWSPDDDDVDDTGCVVLPKDVTETDEESLELGDDIDATGRLLLPDDIDDMDGQPAVSTRREKRRFRKLQHHPGPKREDLPTQSDALCLALCDSSLWPVQPGVLFGDDDVAEIYSPCRVLAHTSTLSLRGELSVDKLTGWDLNTECDRKRLARTLAQRRPRVLVLSPPCTMFSALQATNWFRMQRQSREARWEEAIVHLQLTVFLCTWQHLNQRGFIFEHPATALSWANPLVQDLAQRKGILMCKFHMCAFGLAAQDDSSKFHRKSTYLLTNMPSVYKQFHGKRCPGNHKHIAIQGSAPGGSKRSYWAQHYPQHFCEALAAAIHAYCMEG